jgi:hypothetical protein
LSERRADKRSLEALFDVVPVTAFPVTLPVSDVGEGAGTDPLVWSDWDAGLAALKAAICAQRSPCPEMAWACILLSFANAFQSGI